ncbi:hypothetical protein ABIB62_002908 [Mucilaginibacter sp. UYP25]|uniref:hypothetical protein n=1 Tax=unclassified Mucilaginibacter TaxID=2617802 RepID=UPI003390E55E
MMNQELIEHLKFQLGELEVDYRDGAWETFKRKEYYNQRVIYWRRVLSAAAVLLFLGLLMPGQLDKAERIKTGGSYLSSISKPTQTIKHIGQATVNTQNSNFKVDEKAKLTVEHSKTFPASAENDIMAYVVAAAKKIAPPLSKQAQTASPLTAISGNKSRKNMTMAELFADDSNETTNFTKGATTLNKWTFGVSLGQAMDTRSKADLSIGTHVAYAINSKISISSGLAFSQLGGAKKYGLTDIAGRTGKLQSGSQVNLSGIELPVEVQISTGKQIYARVGLSAFAVIAQRQTIDYSEQKIVSTNFIDENGAPQTDLVTSKEVSTELVGGGNSKQTKMMAFYNLSLGYQQKISKRNTIALEPYVKVPLVSYSEQQLNLIQGGLRIKLGF